MLDANERERAGGIDPLEDVHQFSLSDCQNRNIRIHRAEIKRYARRSAGNRLMGNTVYAYENAGDLQPFSSTTLDPGKIRFERLG